MSENLPDPATVRLRHLEWAREAPTAPGVYQMWGPPAPGETETILYVGKAKSLRPRLVSYFQPETHPIARTQLLVGRVTRIETIRTETEAEALILENSLIKRHKPKFNISLRDDKTYPYLKVARGVDFPRIEWTRKVKRDGGRYFGPFPSAGAAREVLRLLNETYRLRDCSDNTFRHRSRPCILHQMGRCSAPCVGLIGREEYGAQMREIEAILSGRSDRLVKRLRSEMVERSEAEDYESAALIRDRLRSLEVVTATQVVQFAGSDRSLDVFGIARTQAIARGAVVLIRQGALVAVRHFELRNGGGAEESGRELLRDFVTQYYLEQQVQEAKVERALALSDDPEAATLVPERLDLSRAEEALVTELPLEAGVVTALDASALDSAPSEDREAEARLLESVLGVRLRVPRAGRAGEGDHQLLALARSNAQVALEQATRRLAGHGLEALEEVQERLGLERLPSRIECFDISNTQNVEPVASRVVFVDGAPDKNLYRRYKIATVEGQNDFAMMREVIGRRFGNSNEALPDLVVVDGGRGQLSQASAIFEELGVQGVALVGLAKARTESDFQATEVKSSLERVFVPGRRNPIPLYPTTAAYKLLTHVRDEAHRFAINFHRERRAKRSLQTDS